MNRVTNFFLVFVLAFAITNYFSRDINSEISNNQTVTNTTIYKRDVAVEISKTINSIDTNKIDADIANKEQQFSSKLISDLNEELVVLNQEITFLIQQQKFSQFREKHGGVRGIYLNGYHMTNNSKLEINNNILRIIFRDKFNTRRGRVNCSINDEDGWRWFGIQFSVKTN